MSRSANARYLFLPFVALIATPVSCGSHFDETKSDDLASGEPSGASWPRAIQSDASDFAITSPPNGAVLSRVTPLEVSLGSIGPRVATVEYTLGSHSLGIATAPPFSQSWNTGFVADGSVRLTATARDAVGNVLGSAKQDVSLNNLGNSITVEATRLDGTPVDLNGHLSGKIRLTVTATDATYYPELWVFHVDGRLFVDLSYWEWLDFRHTNTKTMVLDTTRFVDGAHEFSIAVHSVALNDQGQPTLHYSHRVDVSPRTIQTFNGTYEEPIPYEVVLSPAHLYVQPGETKHLSCIRNYTNGYTQDCKDWGVQFKSDSGAATVDADGNVTGVTEGFASITASIGEDDKNVGRSFAWVRPNRRVPHFGNDGSRLTSYTPGKSMYVTSPFVLAPAFLKPDPDPAKPSMLAEVRKAGVNTLSQGIFSHVYNGAHASFESWKKYFDDNIRPRIQDARDLGFPMLFTGDGIARVPALDAWHSLNWPYTKQALAYAFNTAIAPDSGGGPPARTIGIEMVDESSMMWGPTPYPKAKIGAHCMFQSIDCKRADPQSPLVCKVDWPTNEPVCGLNHVAAQFRPGTGFQNRFVLLNSKHLSTPDGTAFLARDIDNRGFTFEFPPDSTVPPGLYNAQTDPNLEWSFFWPTSPNYSPELCRSPVGAFSCTPITPNNAIGQIVDMVREANPGIATTWPVLGIADANTAANWMGKNSPADYASHYYDTKQVRVTYPWSWSVQESTTYMRQTYYERQNGMDLARPQLMITSLMGPQYLVGSAQTPHSPAYDPLVDQLLRPGTSPSAITANMLTAAAIGNAGTRLYQYENEADWNARVNVGQGKELQTGAAPFYGQIAHWRAMSYGANLLTKVLAPYVLDQVLDSPGLGEFVTTAARQGSDARMLLVVNGRDWPRSLNVPLELSPSVPYFDVVRYQIGPHGIDVKRLPDGVISDAITLAPGEGVAYLLFARSGGSDATISEALFVPTFPSSTGDADASVASSVLRTSYIYADELEKRTGGGVDCGIGCTMMLDRRIGDVFYQFTYLDSSGAIVGKSDVKRL